MDNEPMVELTEFSSNLYNPVTDSEENLIEVSLNYNH